MCVNRSTPEAPYPCVGEQEYLDNQLAPLFRELQGLTKPKDKMIPRLFDLACQQSLTNHCLDKVAGFTRKDQFNKVRESEERKQRTEG